MLHRILLCMEMAQRGSNDCPHEAALADALGRPCALIDDPVDCTGLHEHLEVVPPGFFEFFSTIEQLQVYLLLMSHVYVLAYLSLFFMVTDMPAVIK